MSADQGPENTNRGTDWDVWTNSPEESAEILTPEAVTELGRVLAAERAEALNERSRSIEWRLRPDHLVAEIATCQLGLITVAQLMACGLSRNAIAHRAAVGRLHRVHRGVYLVGHPGRVPLTTELAALLACGPGAVLSHRSAAAAIWKLLPPATGDVEITLVRKANPRRSGVRVHRTRHLPAADVTRCRGLPVTTPARTVLDLAGSASSRDIERAFDEAHVRGLVRKKEVEELLARSSGRPGVRAVRAQIDSAAEPALTRSAAERRLLSLARQAGLAPPESNVRVGRHEVDFLWRPERLIVEVDGFAFHSSRRAFERDRARDAELQGAGYRVLRVTWRQLTAEPAAVVARLAQALVIARAA